jgi:hypothetical protein
VHDHSDSTDNSFSPAFNKLPTLHPSPSASLVPDRLELYCLLLSFKRQYKWLCSDHKRYHLVTPLTDPIILDTQYRWVSCSPTSPTALRPTERYGAGSVYHSDSKSFYIYGGLAWSDTGNYIYMGDMWVMNDYLALSSVLEWRQVSFLPSY